MKPTVDRRDEQTWVILELNHLGETRVADGTLEPVLRKDLGVDSDFPIFIPAVTFPKDGRAVTIRTMDGYIFIGSGLPETTYFQLERRPYANQVMSKKMGDHGMRVLITVSNAEVQSIRQGLREQVSSDIKTFDQVRVIEGKYQSLEGQVLEIHGTDAFVHVELRSRDVITTIPLVFLEVITDNE